MLADNILQENTGEIAMGLSDLFKRVPAEKAEPVVRDISDLFGTKTTGGLLPAASSQEDSVPGETAKLSHDAMQFKEGKPYLALIGQTFDVWGVVDVVGGSRTHIAVKNVPESILKRTGLEKVEEPVAFERKLLLTSTKVFHDLPREAALEALNSLVEDLQAYVAEMKERLESSVSDYEGDARGWREFLRETEKESMEYWAEDLASFKDELLPQAAADYWEDQREHYQSLAEEAEAARIWALAKIRRPSSE